MLLIYFPSSSAFFLITINFNLIGRAWPPLLQAQYTLIKIWKERLKSNSTKIFLIRPNIWVQQVILKHSSKIPFTATTNLALWPLQDKEQSRRPNRLRKPSQRGNQSISDKKQPAECSIASQMVKSRWNFIANLGRPVQGRGGEKYSPKETGECSAVTTSFLNSPWQIWQCARQRCMCSQLNVLVAKWTCAFCTSSHSQALPQEMLQSPFLKEADAQDVSEK